MTYNELIARLQTQLTPEQRECAATVFCYESDEFLPIDGISIAEEDDVLDKGNPSLMIYF